MLDRIATNLEHYMNLLSARQKLVASNIANADTPHFKARDIDFRSALEGAVAGRRSGDVGLVASSPRHIVAGADSSFAGAIRYRTEFQPSIDGNTVNMDIERSAFAENALRLEAALTFIRSDLKDMQLAMSQ